MNELQIINTNNFNGIECDVYSDGNRIYMTRKQIGQALGYGNPKTAISNIHNAHKERFDNYSGVLDLSTPSGIQKVYLYSQRGIMEICRWSRQKLADDFMDWVWDIIEAYRDGSLVPYRPVPSYTGSCGLTEESALTEESVVKLIDDKLESIKRELRNELLQDLGESTKAQCATDKQVQTIVNSIVQSPLDVIRNTILPLAQKLDDTTKGYNCTYRKVYEAMNVGWSLRQTRYKNTHRCKNKPSKIKLIAEDPNLLKLFVRKTNEMLSALECVQN